MSKINLFISNFEIKDAWRLFANIFLFVPILLMVGAVNIYVDPAGLYRKTVNKHESLEYHIAQALDEGKDVSLLKEDADDRLLQKYFVENMTVAPDIVILGSSHSMWLGNNIFPNKKVINNSVTRAVLPDYLGIFEGYAQKNLYPKRVILLLDPQLIGLPVISERWLSIKEDTYDMLARLRIRSEKIQPPLIPQAWLNIFSFSYFQTSIEDSWNKYKPLPMGENRAKVHGFNQDGKWQVFLKDGRYLRHMKTPSRDITTSRIQILRELLNGTNEKLLKQVRPDKELKDILEGFIRYLMGHHVQVTLCLLPFHPEVYKDFIGPQNKQRTLDIVGIEYYYHDLAKRLNLKVVGSYDPTACDLDGNDFYDGDHIRNDAIEKMLKQKGSRCSMP